MIYFVLLLLLIFITYLNLFKIKWLEKINNKLFLIIGVLIFLLAAIRNEVGFDFIAYKNIHYEINSLGMTANESGMEFGYYLLNILGKYDFAIVIFFSAILGVIIKLLIIDKYSENKWLTLLMYFSGVFIMFDMGVIRQGIAMSIAFLSIKYIMEKDLKKFLAIIFLAMLFHISIILYIPLYFLGDKKIDRKYIYLITIICLIFSLLDIRAIIAVICKFLPEFVGDKLTYYITTSGSGLFISLLKRSLFLILFVEFYRYKNINDSKSNIFLNAYFLSVVLMGIFSSIDTLGGRGSMNLYIYQIFLFAIVINRLSYRKNKIIVLIIVSFLSFNSMIGVINQGEITKQLYVPYKTVFSK